MQTDREKIARLRAAHVAAGLAGGVMLWLVAEVLPDIIDGQRTILAARAAAFGLVGSLLITMGPLGVPRALGLALLVGIVPAALLTWASGRFEDVNGFLSTGAPLVAFGLLVSIPIPFLVAAMQPGRAWRDYSVLFDLAWAMAIRAAVGLAFVGLFWAVLALSDATLKIAGIALIERMLDIEPVPFLITGTVLGLALGVAHELGGILSPFVLLRLLRLLVPVVLAVVGVFVVMIPLRGLSGLFGDLSAAGILMAMAVAAIVLVSAVADRHDTDAPAGGVLPLAARGLSLLLPVLAGLAAYAIAVRVGQYGWSPLRVAAATAALLVLLYALTYAGAVLRGGRWLDRIRRANVALALATAGVAALWLTPVVNPQAMSAKDQLRRFLDGRVGVDEVDFWTIAHDWGRPGAAVLPRFAQEAGQERRAAVERRLGNLATAATRAEFDSAPGESGERALDDLLALMAVRPDGAAFPLAPGAIGNVAEIRAGCDLRTPAGRPGCLAVMADLLPDSGDAEMLVIWLVDAGRARINMWGHDRFGNWHNFWDPKVLGDASPADFPAGLIDELAEQRYTLAPSGIRALEVGGLRLTMIPD